MYRKNRSVCQRPSKVYPACKDIRIRATTIEGWDLKELIVPNKDFIAGQLISWSLSDKIARIGYWLASPMVPIGRHYDCISPA